MESRTKYTVLEDNIRYYVSADEEGMYYCFEIFKRPYFFGLIGKYKWIEQIKTNSYSIGLSFCRHLISKK